MATEKHQQLQFSDQSWHDGQVTLMLPAIQCRAAETEHMMSVDSSSMPSLPAASSAFSSRPKADLQTTHVVNVDATF